MSDLEEIIDEKDKSNIAKGQCDSNGGDILNEVIVTLTTNTHSGVIKISYRMSEKAI